VRCAVLLALGERPNIPAPTSRGAAVRYFNAGRTGVLKDVSGMRKLYGIPGLELLFPGSERDGSLRPGFDIAPVRSSLDRYGHIVYGGEDRQQAVRRADEALDSITFEFADGEQRNAHGVALASPMSLQTL
jgi:hypothetical protein